MKMYWANGETFFINPASIESGAIEYDPEMDPSYVLTVETRKRTYQFLYSSMGTAKKDLKIIAEAVEMATGRGI